MLKRYQSHKIVSAGMISNVKTVHNAFDVADADGITSEVIVENSFFARGVPEDGDYYVVYEDGYESWSTAKAFEEGYKEVQVGEDAKVATTTKEQL